jgi:hypothetical protein
MTTIKRKKGQQGEAWRIRKQAKDDSSIPTAALERSIMLTEGVIDACSYAEHDIVVMMWCDIPNEFIQAVQCPN